jgi:hypothetical protein
MGIFSSKYNSEEKVVIIGGGLVGASLAKIAQENFQVTVVSYWRLLIERHTKG